MIWAKTFFRVNILGPVQAQYQKIYRTTATILYRIGFELFLM